MYPLQKGDTLAKVTRYHLERNDGLLTIEVRWILQGPGAGRYEALPLDRDGEFHVSAALWGEGRTEAAALRDCLEKIRHLAIREVWAHP